MSKCRRYACASLTPYLSLTTTSFSLTPHSDTHAHTLSSCLPQRELLAEKALRDVNIKLENAMGAYEKMNKLLRGVRRDEEGSLFLSACVWHGNARLSL